MIKAYAALLRDGEFLENGRGTRTRTRDLRIWNPLLYQLSYTPLSINKAAPY